MAPRILIIGAGPTGLGAAWACAQAGADWQLCEAESGPGGLSASFQADGFTWDLGGHIIFSHYAEFDRQLDALLPGDQWLRHQRRTYIRFGESWVPYPFQNNLRYLPPALQDECLRGLDECRARPPAAAAPADFEEQIRCSMGAGLAKYFMVPYNTKVWARPPAQMSAGWTGDRVAIPDVERIRRNIREQRDDVGWGPNALFRFPRKGGTGAIWRALADSLPADRMHWNRAAQRIWPDRREVFFSDRSTAPYDALISTLPLDRLTRATGLADLTVLAGTLPRTSTYVVGIGLALPAPPAVGDKCWMYFPEKEYPFYRVTVFSHYSPANAPDGCYSLMAEIAEDPQRPCDAFGLVGKTVAGLRQAGLMAADRQPVHTWVRHLAYGYPVPGLFRDRALAGIQPELERRGIFSRGRFGAWKYEVGNMDHSFMQGVEVVRRLLDGTPEVTVNQPDQVNRPA